MRATIYSIIDGTEIVEHISGPHACRHFFSVFQTVRQSVDSSFYLSVLPKDLNHNEALAAVFGIVRNCAVPMGILLVEIRLERSRYFKFGRDVADLASI